MGTISARAYEIESDPTLTASARGFMSIVEAMRNEFASAGCPFTEAQESFLAEAEAMVRKGAAA